RPVVEEVLKARDEMVSTHAKAAPVPLHEGETESIIGNSMAMQEVIKMIGRVSRSDAPVLITGESGSGKEVVANAIHRFSRRSNADYVAINCAAIPENLLESELFGHEKGSFTGATGRRIGRFEQCNDGSLFLDEIGDMPLPVQSKILRVLQSGEFARLGGNDSLNSSARIIAATNKILEKAVAENSFREDLYYRLNVVRIHIPPLRQRRDDIRPLAQHFLKRIADKGGPTLRLSEEAADMMENYNWPGNVRELENTIYRSSVLATTDVLLPSNIPLGNLGETTTRVRPVPSKPPKEETTADTPPESTSNASSNGRISVEQAVETLLNAAEKDASLELLPWLEREMTTHAMKRTGGNQLQAAKLLGITRATLRKRLERFEIEV
ncbi:MAG: sigma-54 dependent transcriptional regulator, partial [Verrucomicrobiota bacterium]